MKQILAIALGGALGAITRFWVANGIYAMLGRSFPIATLFINVSGSFLMGFLTELMLQRFAMAAEYRAGVLVGFLGAYTTFSTFALETLYLFQSGYHYKALINMLLSTVLCVMACWFGLIWGRTIFLESLSSENLQNHHYINLLLSFLGTFLLAIVIEFLCQRFSVSEEIRSLLFVLVLGIVATVITIISVYQYPEYKFSFTSLLILYVINSIICVTIVYLGSWLGKSIWQLTQSL